MRSFLRKKLTELRRCQSGNALMLVALGMPVLIGGTGIAVDTSQWYMWKGELQYAADQAAIAGAWARTKDDTEGTYVQRAQQEFATNLEVGGVTKDIASAATVTLANFGSGTQNSVVVRASATKRLPFSYFLMGEATTVRVRAQAAFEPGVIVSSCLVAVDNDASGAITFGGSAEFVAGCGVKALSTANEAITVNGNPKINAGTLLAAGGIDDWFNTPSVNNIGNTPVENFEGLVDDFAELEPPSPPQSQVARGRASDYCSAAQTTENYMADSVTTRTQITYTYWTKSGNNYNSYNYTGAAKKTNVDTTPPPETNVTLSALPAGAPNTTVISGPANSGYVQVDRIGNTRIYERSTTTTTKTYVNARLLATAQDGGAGVLLPGTYTDMRITCDTVFRPGVYVLDGGTFEIHGQHDVTGTGIMLVLKNGAGIIINGGSSVNLTAMTIPELQAAGIPYDDAVELDGMLIFEDRDSEGNSHNKINGNSSTVLNGTVYLPVSNLDIRGSAGVTSQCLLLVASTITISGNVEMTSFCPPNLTQQTQVTTVQSRVRLVS
jgi:Flp pilus assembly protein TadG